jgi:hypothetical protein
MRVTEEVGRRLKASELQPRQIVVIAPPGRQELITMYVVEARHNLAVFYSGILKLHIVNIIGEDDELKDDQGRLVRVYEYLGEP